MEPNLVTDPKLEPVLRELMDREPIFHRPVFGRTRADLENATAAEFWEVGASGRRYSREHVIDSVEKRGDTPEDKNWVTSDFHCLEIAPDNYLLTYNLLQGQRRTRRSAIWRRSGDTWKIVYHQGTIVSET
jgi:hypothetical protein